MARLIPRNFDYQPKDAGAFKWEEAPPAPAHFQCRRVLDWDSKDWDKSYAGCVWADSVRDALYDTFGIFGTFRTPFLLDQAGFEKLCYLVVGDGNLRDYADGKYERWSFVTTKRPKNYLPFKFYDKPLEWFTHQGRFHLTFEADIVNEDLKNDLFIDDVGQLVKTNDQVRLVNCSKTVLNGTVGTVYYHEPYDWPSILRVYVATKYGRHSVLNISIHNLRKYIPTGTDLSLGEHVVDWSKMPPERTRLSEKGADKKIGLCDLSTDVKQHISSFLPLLDVERNLRRACRDTFWNFKTPPPDSLEYDFVYFSVSIGVPGYYKEVKNKQWHGVAHTTNDVLVSIWNYNWRSDKNNNWGSDSILIALKFVKFDQNHSPVPLLENKFMAGYFQAVNFDPLGCHFCGVQQASHVTLDSSTIFLDGGRDDPDRIDDAGAVFRHCRDWTPREPRIPLRHFGLREKVYGRTCAGGFHIYYSPKWFEDIDDFAFSTPSDSRHKSAIIFEQSFYWWSAGGNID